MEWWGGIQHSYSPYVTDYISRVVAADVAAGNTQGLESGTMDAFSSVIEGLVFDGLLGVSGGVISQSVSTIKAMCFMCGARTLLGSLVPVVGPPPTSLNFTSGDYNRKTGLLGNGSTKYLNTNRNNAADPQDNNHNAVFLLSTASVSQSAYIAADSSGNNGSNTIRKATNAIILRSRYNASADTPVGTANPIGFLGLTRSSAAQFTARVSGANTLIGASSSATFSTNVTLFARNAAAPNSFADARISFYSIGESLDLAVLDARISTLMATLATVIP
jgi:hypothetical protein